MKSYVGLAAFVAFFGWGAILLSEPTYAYGRVFGLEQYFVIGGLLIISVFVAGCSAHHLLGGKAKLSLVVAVFVASPIVYEALLRFFDRDGDVTRSLVAAKIDYHCVSNFHLNACVTSINECPACTRMLAPERRAIAHKRVDDLNNELIKARIEHEEQMFQRAPASRGR